MKASMWCLHTSQCLMFIFLLATQRLVSCTTIDLTHVMNPETFVFSGNPAYNHTSLMYDFLPNTDVFINSGMLVVSEHSGTHLDSPAHFNKGNSN